MEYSILGKTGLNVSKLGLGGAPIGGDFHEVDESEVLKVIHEAIDLGINFVDTAPLYGKGKSEERFGKALLGGKRKQVIIATKAVYFPEESYSYENTVKSVERSLTRLRTEWIDVLQIHDIEFAGEQMIMTETLPALLKMREQGKIRFIGVTTCKLDLLMKFMNTGLFDTIQFYARYMLIDHTAKDEVLPLANKLNMGVINGSVLGLGILADAPGKFLDSELKLKAQQKVDQLGFLRRTEPRGLVEPSMRFSLGHPDIHVSLTGTASIDSLRNNAVYCDGKGLDEGDLEKVYSLFQGQKLLE